MNRASELSALRLQMEFDRTFAEPHPSAAPPHSDFLELRVAGHRYAVPLLDVVAVHADKKLVPAPSPRTELRGLVGLRGVVCPVYDLAQLLGHAPDADARWLLQVRAPTPLALAFEQLDRHVRVATSAVHAPPTQTLGGVTSRRVETDAGVLPVLDLLGIFEELTRAARPSDAIERREERT
jgi:purine-binding chemotaxis protein CheW